MCVRLLNQMIPKTQKTSKKLLELFIFSFEKTIFVYRFFRRVTGITRGLTDKQAQNAGF